MAKTKNQKQDLLDKYSEKLKQYDTFFVVKPLAINPNEATAMKKELAVLGSSYNLVKNSIFELALKENNSNLTKLGDGQHSIIFSSDKISETAKVLSKFLKNKDSDRLEIISGVYNKGVITDLEIKALSELPSKEVLIAQLLSVMVGPIRNLMYVLKGNMQEFVYLLNSIQEKKAVN
jgi:large subunit ribosomal protein L10